MIEVKHSEISNNLIVLINDVKINCVIVEKPFYDPKKKIASS